MPYRQYFFLGPLLFFISHTICASEFEDQKVSDSTTQTLSTQSSPTPLNKPYSILLIEEGENSLGVYHSETKKEIGRVKLNFYPHEIEISPDGKRAYVSNFGIRDYDAKIGYPGNSISVIDLEKFCEVDRLYTTYKDTTLQEQQYWGPHGLKVHPDGEYLYVNVECVHGRYPTSNAPQDSRMLIFNLATRETEKVLPPFSDPDSHVTSYSLSAGTHNFIFSPKSNNINKPGNRHLWYYAGPNGVFCINSITGALIRHYPTNMEQPLPQGKVFNGAVRGLAFNEDGTQILVSAKNEISIIDLSVESETYGEIITQIGNLGVNQLFYSKFIPGTNLVLAPAARESQVLVIDTSPDLNDNQRVVKRLVTGIDPLQVILSPIQGEKKAYVTNADSPWISEITWDSKNDLEFIDLESFKVKTKIPTKGGANGIAFSQFLPTPPTQVLKLGACLPFTGQYAAEGRECFLGIQFWQEVINGAGGVVVKGERYEIDVGYEDTGSTTDDNELAKIVLEFLKMNLPRQRNDGILAMFGVYPPSANLAVAKILSAKGIPLITSTGREPSLFNEGLSNVFGISPLKQKPDLIGTFQAIYKCTTPKPRTAMVLSCDDSHCQEEAKTLAIYLIKNGIKVLSPFIGKESEEMPINVFKHCRAYEESTELKDLIKMMDRLNREAQENCQYYPDLLFVSGHRKESAVIINTCAKNDLTHGALALDVGVTSHHFLVQVTASIENLLGSVCWSDTCSAFAKDRFVASTDFQRMFYERYSENPSELVAGFAASGIVIEEALKKSEDKHWGGGDFSGKALQESLRNINLTTFYGPITFAPNGSNITKPMITVQLRTQDSKLRGIPIWPKSLAGNERPTFPSTFQNSQVITSFSKL